jgi:hypothetical protein
MSSLAARTAFARNLFERVDSGVDAGGEPVGGRGDGVLTRGELAFLALGVSRSHMADEVCLVGVFVFGGLFVFWWVFFLTVVN